MGFEFGEERDKGLRQLQDLRGATLQSNFAHGNSFGIYIKVKLGGSKDYLNWKGLLRTYEVVHLRFGRGFVIVRRLNVVAL